MTEQTRPIDPRFIVHVPSGQNFQQPSDHFSLQTPPLKREDRVRIMSELEQLIIQACTEVMAGQMITREAIAAAEHRTAEVISDWNRENTSKNRALNMYSKVLYKIAATVDASEARYGIVSFRLNDAAIRFIKGELQ